MLALGGIPIEKCWVSVIKACGFDLYEKSHPITSVVNWRYVNKIDLTYLIQNPWLMCFVLLHKNRMKYLKGGGSFARCLLLL